MPLTCENVGGRFWACGRCAGRFCKMVQKRKNHTRRGAFRCTAVQKRKIHTAYKIAEAMAKALRPRGRCNLDFFRKLAPTKGLASARAAFCPCCRRRSAGGVLVLQTKPSPLRCWSARTVFALLPSYEGGRRSRLRSGASHAAAALRECSLYIGKQDRGCALCKTEGAGERLRSCRQGCGMGRGADAKRGRPLDGRPRVQIPVRSC